MDTSPGEAISRRLRHRVPHLGCHLRVGTSRLSLLVFWRVSQGISRRRFSLVIRPPVWTNWSSWPFASTSDLRCAIAHATPRPSQGQLPLLSRPPQWFRLFQIPWNWGVFAYLLLSVSVVSQGGSVCIVACRGTLPLGVR